jgi:hypothetical protein
MLRIYIIFYFQAVEGQIFFCVHKIGGANGIRAMTSKYSYARWYIVLYFLLGF